MSNDRTKQLERFFTTQLGEGWRAGPFVYLDGWKTITAVWPMNEVFRTHHAQIASLAYSPAFEAEADVALALLAEGGAWSAARPSAGAWRVLYERHIQTIMLATANHAAGNAKLVPVPTALKPVHHKIAAMLFLQWAMELPFPLQNRSAFPWPAGSEPDSLLQH